MVELGTPESGPLRTRERAKMPPAPVAADRPYGDSGIAALMASEALSAAACNDFVDRCA